MPDLSPAQETSLAESTARLNIWQGSVRSGKTVASLLRWLIYVNRPPPGGSLVVVGKTVDTVARNVFAPLTDPSIVGDTARQVRYTRGAPTATMLGRTVDIITANDARAEGRLRGLTAAGAYIDEASLIPEEFWTQLLARLSVPGAKLFATTNPDSPVHWLRRKFLQRGDVLDLASWHFTLDDNHALNADYVAALKTEYVGLWYRRFILGEWVAAEGAVYDMFDLDTHVVDQLPLIRRWVAVGVDYGTSNPSHAVLVGLGEDRRLYVTSEWRYDATIGVGSLTDMELSRRLRDWLTTTPDWIAVDPSAASFAEQLWRDGLTPTPADNEVLDGIRTVASLLATNQLKVHTSCHHLIGEMVTYAWDDNASTRGEDKPLKQADHGPDALRYALFTTRALWHPELNRG